MLGSWQVDEFSNSYHLYRWGNVKVGSAIPLSAPVQTELISCLDGEGDGVSGILAGRAPVRHKIISGLGPVVIKGYVRGGLLRFARSPIHMRFGRTRCEREFGVLQKVRQLGIAAPEPLAFAWRGGRWYRAWLFTRLIEGTRTLADISRADENRARVLAERLAPIVELLILKGVFHVDLHPGNVVVDEDDKIYLVDFDKARIVTGREHEQLADRYLCRWRRAVIKHNLSEVLTEVLCSSLRRRDLLRSNVRGDL